MFENIVLWLGFVIGILAMFMSGAWLKKEKMMIAVIGIVAVYLGTAQRLALGSELGVLFDFVAGAGIALVLLAFFGFIAEKFGLRK